MQYVSLCHYEHSEDPADTENAKTKEKPSLSEYETSGAMLYLIINLLVHQFNLSYV